MTPPPRTRCPCCGRKAPIPRDAPEDWRCARCRHHEEAAYWDAYQARPADGDEYGYEATPEPPRPPDLDEEEIPL
jgi:hypothetical protein